MVLDYTFTEKEFSETSLKTLIDIFNKTNRLEIITTRDNELLSLIHLKNYYSKSGLTEIILLRKYVPEKSKWYSQGDEDGYSVAFEIKLSPLIPERAVGEFIMYFNLVHLEGKKHLIKSLTEEEEIAIKNVINTVKQM